MAFCTLKGACIAFFIAGSVLLAIGIAAVPVIHGLITQQVRLRAARAPRRPAQKLQNTCATGGGMPRRVGGRARGRREEQGVRLAELARARATPQDTNKHGQGSLSAV